MPTDDVPRWTRSVIRWRTAAAWVALIFPSTLKVLPFFEFWHTIEFFLDKLKQFWPFADDILATLSTHWLLMIALGIVWTLLSVARDMLRPRATATSVMLTSVVARDRVKHVLERELRHGRAIATSPTALLAATWGERLEKLLRAAFGEIEARVFTGDDEIAPQPSLAAWVESRCERLENLLSRLPYTNIRPTFRPDKWVD